MSSVTSFNPQKFANTLMKTIIGLPFAYGLAKFVGTKFIEQDEMTAKMSARSHYVDFWPATCKKARAFLGSFWNRRTEGALATTAAGFGLAATPLLQEKTSEAIWNVAKKITAFFLNRLPGVSGWKSTDLGMYLLAGIATPSLIGAGAILTLGTYDLVHKYLKQDVSFDIKPVFNADSTAYFDRLLIKTQQAKINNDHFSNLVLFGPPGTGKTTVAKWLAKESGMNFFQLSGSDLTKSDSAVNGKHTIEFQTILDHAKNLSGPSIIFIDEAEVCCLRKHTDMEPTMLRLVNSIIEATGQSSNKIMFVFATNYPAEIEPAILNRMHNKHLVNLPDAGVRQGIVQLLVNCLFKTPEERIQFTPKLVQHIAEKTNNFAGRDLCSLMQGLKSEMRLGQRMDQACINRQLEEIEAQEKSLADTMTAFSAPVAKK